jgi:hypothetical protein
MAWDYAVRAWPLGYGGLGMTEPAQWADLVAHLRAQLAAAHREGYEMAQAEARELGVFLRRYDLAKNRHDGAK